MKKIFAFVFMIMMFCQVCVAFTPPDSNRWVKIPGDNIQAITFWLDAKTLRFEEKYSENYANCWIMFNKAGEETYELDNIEINMSKREYKILSTIRYNGDGSVKESISIPSTNMGITPGSMLEGIYEVVHIVYLDQGKNPSN